MATPEAVTDTLAHLETFTVTSAWTSNAGVRSDFTLVAADTVANLIDAANTTALGALHGTTLNGNQSATAGQAEALVGLESTIHFSLGSNQLTVSDTAAHLLDPVNADGLALANGNRGPTLGPGQRPRR